MRICLELILNAWQVGESESTIAMVYTLGQAPMYPRLEGNLRLWTSCKTCSHRGNGG